MKLARAISVAAASTRPAWTSSHYHLPPSTVFVEPGQTWRGVRGEGISPGAIEHTRDEISRPVSLWSKAVAWV
jgi:hypothetical protein